MSWWLGFGLCRRRLSEDTTVLATKDWIDTVHTVLHIVACVCCSLASNTSGYRIWRTSAIDGAVKDCSDWSWSSRIKWMVLFHVCCQFYMFYSLNNWHFFLRLTFKLWKKHCSNVWNHEVVPKEELEPKKPRETVLDLLLGPEEGTPKINHQSMSWNNILHRAYIATEGGRASTMENNASRFPCLSKVVHSLPNIPATSTPSKWVLSAAG